MSLVVDDVVVVDVLSPAVVVGLSAEAVMTGTDWMTADCTTLWIMKGLALSCLGGGLLKLSMMSDMACWAWDRKWRQEE